MGSSHFVLLLALTLPWLTSTIDNAEVPEQVHIALGSNSREIVVTWHTLFDLQQYHVEYGTEPSSLDFFADVESSYYEKINLYTYRALLIDLKPLTKYYYRIGGSKSSRVFSFRTTSNDPNWLPTIAIYGDLGYESKQALSYLEAAVDNEMYDALFHIGDIGYDLDQKCGERGNEFMRSIEKIASRVIYMTCPGNHERRDNFMHYDVRFSMLGDRGEPDLGAPLKWRINNHYHSLDLGPLHLVMFSTEVYYNKGAPDMIRRQYEWLQQDLAKANANRAERPWIVVMGHRPMYCFTKRTDCDNTSERKSIRLGVTLADSTLPQYGLEELFFNHSVDLQFYGHDHYYARLFAVYDNNQVGAAPIHVVSGNAGNTGERHAFDTGSISLQKLVTKQSNEFGYTRLRVLSRLKIVLEHVSVERNGSVIDQLVISKADKPNL